MSEHVRRVPVRRAVCLIAEEVAARPEEGYDRVVVELDRALRRQADVTLHVARPAAPRRGPVARPLRRLKLHRLRVLLEAARALRGGDAELRIVYASRSSTTLAAFVRVTLLRVLTGGRRVTMLALQPRSTRRALRYVVRWLRPDRLLVVTAAQAQQARELGIPVAAFTAGVDADRFRPPSREDKQSLRRSWGLDASVRIVLHVGHLTSGRNLEALIPLTSLENALVVVVCSSRRDAASEALRRGLEAAGIRVLHSYLPAIEDVYRLADCYVFPTVSGDHAIGLPLSILEAMGCGLPVATTRFGAVPEHLEAAPGVRIVDDPADLPRAVEELLASGGETRPLVADFSWDRAAAAILA